MNNIFGQRVLIYEGSTKLIYAGTDSTTLIVHFLKRDDYDVLRNRISESIWRYLTSVGIDNHYIKTLNIREHLVSAANVYPIFLRLHNIAHLGLTERLGIELGTSFPSPLMEWHLKSKYLKDPLVSRDHIEYFQWLTKDEVKSIQRLALRANDVLRALFHYIGIKPSVIELQFGLRDNQIILVGELSPETIIFWDDLQFQAITAGNAYDQLKLHYLRDTN